ncbi:MAG: glycosyl transferase family 2 [Sphingobacteriales bacterium BACL12 MAG-120813-bin55]|nr:MAG: glycosyl transferase family 2 [Sphingobacteriales bacterium BACL12 MAG-120802-bin5]KRP12374.1 MAG: glycosyl transferase family 2 [Sphingobacteriales bacterium BACL12 MAG-120813-bin55]
MKKISAIITSYNEAPNIERALQSLSWCDELIVVDSFSDDGTFEIAQKYTDKVWQRKYIHPADQKNWAIPQAAHPWIILLDADEWVPADLQAEIRSWLATPEIPYVAFWIYRNNHFMGKRIRYSGWQRDKVIRFFQRDLCRYPDQMVHEEIIASGPVGKLKNRLEHNTFRSLEHFRAKMDRYAAWSAVDKEPRTGRITAYHMLVKPAFRFFKHFILDLGWLDGYRGYLIAQLNARAIRMRYIKMKAARNANSGTHSL